MNWEPGEDFVFRIDDQTGENKDIESMIEEIRIVVNKYDFDFTAYGSWESMRKLAIEEGKFLEKFK